MVLGLVGFYLYDSAQLYFYNEFSLYKGVSNTFQSATVSANLNIFSKYLVIPNSFLSYRLMFKCAWKIQDIQSSALVREIEEITCITKILKPLQYINMLLFILTLVLLPLVIALKLGYLLLAIILVAIYFLNLISITMVIFKRKPLKLSRTKILHLFLDSLLCPPFALNLLRKISLNYQIHSEGTLLAQALLSTEHYQNLIATLLKDLDMLKIDADPKRLNQLSLRQQQLSLAKDTKLHQQP